MIIDDRREPRPRGLALLVQDQNVQEGVVGLPEGVRRLRPVAVNQLEAITEGGWPVLRQSDHCRVEGGEDRMHGGVGRSGPALSPRRFNHPPVDGGCGPARPLEPKALDQGNELGRQPAPASVAANEPGQALNAILAVARQPALCGPEWHARLRRDPRERHFLLKGGLEHGQAGHSLAASVFGERREGSFGRLGRVPFHGEPLCQLGLHPSTRPKGDP